MMQITDASTESKLTPLLRLAFRPFFLFGSLFSLAAIALWVGSLNGWFSFTPYGSSLWWHTHEMLFGFVCAIIAGFLLTAVQTWTGLRGLRGTPLLLLVLLWLAGRIALLLDLGQLQWLAAVIDLLFLPCVALLMANYVVRVKQWRNLVFTPLLLGLTLANALMHSAVIGAFPAGMQLGSTIAVLLISLVIFVVGGRVIPFFTSRACGFDKPQPLVWLEAVGAISLLAVIITLLVSIGWQVPKEISIVLWATIAISQLLRMARWRPQATLSNPLLWSLHLSYLFIPIGALLALGFHLGWVYSMSPAIHALTVGGMGGLILAMLARVSLGHTGRPLKAHPQMSIAFAALLLAALIRSVLPALMPQWLVWGWSLSALGWIIGYGLFMVHYSKILSTPRADGRPG
ncbi:NnrS family protein [Corallincola luteus]|uniref:NnrS family protein n=1 Tax=Corallincola luteus TaxID=1775177 RepID=A0ABY2ASL3_9GAMM|nr:NnrS family protein [Corallincola luteus]TCI05286.1 NnrS family protein [Corallincola luteus]